MASSSGKEILTRDNPYELIYSMVTDIKEMAKALLYQANDSKLREVVEYLEKALKPFKNKLGENIHQSVTTQSFARIPKQLENDSKDYRREKARFLSQLATYTAKLFLEDGRLSSVTKEYIEDLQALRGQTACELKRIRNVYEKYPIPTPPRRFKERADYFKEPTVICHLDTREKERINNIIEIMNARKGEEKVRLEDRAKEQEKQRLVEDGNVKRDVNDSAMAHEHSNETEDSNPTADNHLGFDSNYSTPNENTSPSQNSLAGTIDEETPLISPATTETADASSKEAPEISYMALPSATPLSESIPPAELSSIHNFEPLQSVESKTSEINGTGPKALQDLAAIPEVTQSNTINKDNAKEAVQDLVAAPGVEILEEAVQDSSLVPQVQHPEHAEDHVFDAVQDADPMPEVEGRESVENAVPEELVESPIIGTEVERAKDIEENGSEPVRTFVPVPGVEEPAKAGQDSVHDSQAEDPEDAEDNGPNTAQKNVNNEWSSFRVATRVWDGDRSYFDARSPSPEHVEPLVMLLMPSKTLVLKERRLCDIFPRMESYLKEKKAKGERLVDMDQLATFLATYGQHEKIRPLCFMTFIKYIKGLEKVKYASRVDKIIEMEDLGDALYMLLLFLDPGTTLNLDEGTGILKSVELLAAVMRVPSYFQVARVLGEARYSNIFKVLRRVPKLQEYWPGGNIPEVENISDDSDSDDDIPAETERSLEKAIAEARALASLNSRSTEEAYADFEEERQAEIAQKAHDRAYAKRASNIPVNDPDMRRVTRTQAADMGLSFAENGKTKPIISKKRDQKKLVIGRVLGCDWVFVPSDRGLDLHFEIDEDVLYENSTLIQTHGQKMLDELVVRPDSDAAPTIRYARLSKIFEFCKISLKNSKAVKASVDELEQIPDCFRALQMCADWIHNPEKPVIVNTQFMSKIDALKIARFFGVKPEYIRALENAAEV